MTEQEAHDKGYKQGYADRIEMEKALRVTDCISRSDVHDLIATWLSDYLTDETREVLETIDGKIEDLPEIEPTRAKGNWIEHEKVFECSECQIIRAKGTTGKYNYCPSCGARMDGEEK